MERLRRIVTPYVVARNALDYPLRRLIRPQRPVTEVAPAGLAEALGDLPPDVAARGRELIAQYGLAPLAARGRRGDLRQGLYYLELIVAALVRADLALPDPVTAADVGSGDWFYASALHGALRFWGADEPRAVELLGFETDPGRVFLDGYTREAWAAWHVEGLVGARYVPEDARSWNGSADVVTLLFPFLFARDHDDWGLPRRLLRPAALLRHVWARVRPGGLLVVANQGERERDVQRRLFDEVGVEARTEPFASPFWAYDLPRFVHVAAKRASSASSTAMPSPGLRDST